MGFKPQYSKLIVKPYDWAAYEVANGVAYGVSLRLPLAHAAAQVRFSHKINSMYHNNVYWDKVRDKVRDKVIR